MRSGVESAGFEIVAKLFEKGPGLARVARELKQAVHRVHPKADGFHVKGRDGAAKGLGFLDDLFARGSERKSGQERQQAIEGRQRGRGSFRHEKSVSGPIPLSTDDADHARGEPEDQQGRYDEKHDANEPIAPGQGDACANQRPSHLGGRHG